MEKKDIGIQAIRGCACIMVFLSHFIGTFPNGFFVGNYNMQTSPFRIIWGGNAAVIIFFVLSGFFSYKGNRFITFQKYFKLQIKRHVRIYPAFLIAMVIALIAMLTCIPFEKKEISSWAASFWLEKSTLTEYLKNFVLLSSFDSHLLNPPIWTLRVEMRMFLLLPFIDVMISRFGTGNKKWFIYIFSTVISSVVPQLNYMSAFILGMCFRDDFKNKGFVVNKLRKMNKNIISIACIFLLDTEYLISSLKMDCPEAIVINLTAFGSVFLILFVSRIKKSGYIFYFFSFLGDLSYEFYLIHFVVLMWMRFSIGYIGMVFYGFSSFLISALAAYGMVFCEEKIKRLLIQRS